MSDKQPTENTLSTRRDFLKTAAAGTALAAGLSFVPHVHAAGDDKIKVGIIGCGGRGSGAGENVLQAAAGVEIVALGDVFKFRVDGCRRSLQNFAQKDETARTFGNSVNLPDERCFVGLDCHDKVIASGANYIILASPPGFRPLHLQAAVAAGKNIFTEKPVAVDGTGSRKVFAAYDESLKKGLAIGAGTQRRHQTSYLEAMKRVHGGDIGDITALRCYWNGGGIWFHTKNDLAKKGEKVTELGWHLYNWYHWVWTCGDHIVEQHVHNIDVCNWAMQGFLKDKAHPVKAVGMGSRRGGHDGRPDGAPKDAGHIFDNFAIDFEYANGVHMLSMCRHIPGCENSVSEAITGAKGTLRTSDRAYCEIKGEKAWSFPVKKDNKPYVQEHTDLIQSIRAGKPINELKNVAESTLTAIMGRMSAYTGKAVTWDKALNSKEDTMPNKLSWDMSLTVPDVAVPGKTELI